MSKIKEAPEKLQPYLFHGVQLEYAATGISDAKGVCPFCDKEKFFVSQETGMFNCRSCNEGNEQGGGNIYTFLSKLYTEFNTASTSDYRDLAKQRNVRIGTLKRWGCALSPITDEWILPTYNPEGKLSNVYRYATFKDQDTDKLYKRLIGTPTLNHQLFGFNPSMWKARKPDLFVCEGPWDGMALREVLGECTPDFDYTEEPKETYLNRSNVIAVPGCGTFKPYWAKIFKNKNVIFIYDNDHPRGNKKTGKMQKPAAWSGLKRAVNTVATSRYKPKSLLVVQWGSQGYDLDLPNGFDLRDQLDRKLTSHARSSVELN
jgi:ribosomal protein L37AE/L43A